MELRANTCDNTVETTVKAKTQKPAPKDRGPHSDFYAWRRQYQDEILFDPSIKPKVKLVALAVSYSTNCETRATYESYSTFARRLGLKRDQVEEAAEWLRSDGRLKIERRNGRVHLEPVTKGDAPCRSTNGDRDFCSRRVAWCKAILARCDLTPAERIVYCGIAANADESSGFVLLSESSQATIASRIGISRRTMTDAVRHLRNSGVLDVAGDAIKLSDPSASEETREADSGQREATRKLPEGYSPPTQEVLVAKPLESLDVDHHSLEYSDLSRDPSNTPSNTPGSGHSDNPTISVGCVESLRTLMTPDSYRVARRGGEEEGVEEGVDHERWCALCDLITGDYAKYDKDGYPCQTIAGIIKLSDPDYCPWISADAFSGAEVRGFLRAGLLIQEGKWVSVTEAGDRFYEHGEQQTGPTLAKAA
jgi:biotin operon repressor